MKAIKKKVKIVKSKQILIETFINLLKLQQRLPSLNWAYVVPVRPCTSSVPDGVFLPLIVPVPVCVLPVAVSGLLHLSSLLIIRFLARYVYAIHPVPVVPIVPVCHKPLTVPTLPPKVPPLSCLYPQSIYYIFPAIL